MAVPFLVAVTEVLFRSPNVSTMDATTGELAFRFAPLSVVNVIVGPETSTSTVNDELTATLDLLSVALKMRVCVPALMLAAKLKTTLFAVEIIADCQKPASTLKPTRLMVTA